MSKFFDDTMQGLLEAVAIKKDLSVSTGEIIKAIMSEVVCIECTYNFKPNKIILGANIMTILKHALRCDYQSNETIKTQLMGIDVDVDCMDPNCIKVCMEWPVQIRRDKHE